MGRGNSGAAIIESRGNQANSITVAPANEDRLARYARQTWKYERQLNKEAGNFWNASSQLRNLMRREEASTSRAERAKLRKQITKARAKAEAAEKRRDAAMARVARARRVEQQYWGAGVRASARADTQDAIREGARSASGIRLYGGARAYRRYLRKQARQRR